MTGFGKSEKATAAKKITVEIRSLNGKQLDLSVRMPGKYRSLDPEVRAAASKVLARGKADISVSVENLAAASDASIDREVFAAYLKQVNEVAAGCGVDTSSASVAGPIAAAVLRLPDVVSNNSDTVPEEESAAFMDAVREALSAIDAFRTEEGRVLMADILARVNKVEGAIPELEPYEKERVEATRKRLAEAVEKSGVSVDSNRLEQEMIFYLEKFDVTEEKVRLANHCRYFAEVAAQEENPGRKLGFIAQEMGREINTLGSKANHASIQRVVVGMKDELEKIKEQLLNIL